MPINGISNFRLSSRFHLLIPLYRSAVAGAFYVFGHKITSRFWPFANWAAYGFAGNLHPLRGSISGKKFAWPSALRAFAPEKQKRPTPKDTPGKKKVMSETENGTEKQKTPIYCYPIFINIDVFIITFIMFYIEYDVIYKV